MAQATILVVIGLTLVTLTLAAINQLIIRPAFQALEFEHSLEDSDRALAALDNELTSLAELANDWAYWDDAYTFAQNRNQNFIDTNYPDATTLSESSGIDLLVFVDRNNHLLLTGVHDPLEGRNIPLQLLAGNEPAVRTLLAPTLKNETPIEGIVSTEHGLLLLVARPILTSKKIGPSHGAVLLGRFLNQRRIKVLTERTKVAFTLIPHHSLNQSDKLLFVRLIPTAVNRKPTLLGESVYRILNDIEQKPLAMLQTPVHQDFMVLGQRTSKTLSFFLGSIALVLLIILAIYRWRMHATQFALQESETRYRQLFEAESDAIFLIDSETGQIIEANKAAISLYKYDYEEILNLKNTDFSAEPEITEQFAHDTLAPSDEIITIPIRLHRKKDGTIFPVEITTRFFILKDRLVYIAAVRDITERQKNEHRLRFTQFAVDHIGDAAFWINNEGVFIYVNKEGCRSLGYSLEELKGKTIADIDPEYPFEAWPEYWQELKFQKNMLLESVHKAKDGQTFPVEIRANYVEFCGHGYNCAFVRDISERKRMESERIELEELNREMQKEESLGRMAGAIAHIFNNYLMAVMGFIELALDELHNQEGKATRDLNSAMTACRKAAKVSTLMLTYLGQTPLNAREPRDLTAVCQDFLPLLEAILPANTTLETNFQLPGPVVPLNIDQVHQIITNLVTNSIEAIGAHSGWIELNVKTVLASELPPTRYVPVGWHPRDEVYACLMVSDNGCGIAPNNIEKLFDPFFTSKFTGRGLGLPVALGLAKAHGGAISVVSEQGQGSVFQVILPLQKVVPAGK